MIYNEKKIRKVIRESLAEMLLQTRAARVLKEQPEDALSNADFTNSLKTGAAEIASSIPAKLNDDMAQMIKALTAMAQYDKSKFEKMRSYIEQAGVNALEKSDNSEEAEKPE